MLKQTSSQKNAEKKSTPKKIGHRFPFIFVLFIHPKPNNIGPARQQPRDGLWFSSISLESGQGEGHTFYLLALRLD